MRLHDRFCHICGKYLLRVFWRRHRCPGEESELDLLRVELEKVTGAAYLNGLERDEANARVDKLKGALARFDLDCVDPICEPPMIHPARCGECAECQAAAACVDCGHAEAEHNDGEVEPKTECLHELRPGEFCRCLKYAAPSIPEAPE